jgi:hypothetical protein
VSHEQLLTQAVTLLQWLIGMVGGGLVIVLAAAFRAGGHAHELRTSSENLREIKADLKRIPELVTAVAMLKEIVGRQQSDHRELRRQVTGRSSPELNNGGEE